MAKVEVKTPTMIIIDFRQNRSDEDYGSCLWARFVLDTENYEMHISSDCGEYCYRAWDPISQTESFLKLVSRMDSDYLLSKISDVSDINIEKTYSAITELLRQESEHIDADINALDMDSLYTACTYDSETDIVLAIRSELKHSPLFNESIDDFSLYECIAKDYPLSAKKIVRIFRAYIQPKIKEMLK